MQARISYIFIIFGIIIFGILSRKISIIPLFIGDLLYATMMYFIIRTIFLKLPKTHSAILSLLICFCIELSQLYQASWINEIRNTTLGHYILGQGFLWSDLVAYGFGIAFAYIFDRKIKNSLH